MPDMHLSASQQCQICTSPSGEIEWLPTVCHDWQVPPNTTGEAGSVGNA